MIQFKETKKMDCKGLGRKNIEYINCKLSKGQKFLLTYYQTGC